VIAFSGLFNRSSLTSIAFLDQGQDVTPVLEQDKDDSAEGAGETSPRLDLSKMTRGIRPPPKAFTARPLKRGLFRTSTLSISRETSMSDRFTSDRMAAFNPQIPRRVADIPGPGAARGTDDVEGKRLIVGKQVRIHGEVSGCERLVVDGHVDAKVSGVKTLDVTANGTFKGSSEVDSATIAGTYDGDLKVNGHLEIAASGVVTGKVSYKTIAVANGGRLQGAIETL
jgi:cytoskeletal protein CcmA (bactofilin family)